jgi:hypothetical protein
MKNLGKSTIALCFFSVHMMVSCTEKKRENLEASRHKEQTAASKELADEDSIHEFTINDIEKLEGNKSALAPLEGPFGEDLRVTVRSAVKYSAENKLFAEAVAKRLEIVLNSQAFHDLVTSQTYDSIWAKDLTPTQIYEKLMQGKEPSKFNVEDGVIDLQLKQDNRCKPGKLGYRWSTSDTIYTYKCYIDRTRTDSDLADITLAELGGHYIHEHLHVLGFGHSENNRKMASVPYRIGNIVRLLALNDMIVKGEVSDDLTFRTKRIFDNQFKNFTVYQSHYGASPLEPLEELSQYKGRTIKIRFQMFDNGAIYGAEVVK